MEHRKAVAKLTKIGLIDEQTICKRINKQYDGKIHEQLYKASLIPVKIEMAGDKGRTTRLWWTEDVEKWIIKRDNLFHNNDVKKETVSDEFMDELVKRVIQELKK